MKTNKKRVCGRVFASVLLVLLLLTSLVGCGGGGQTVVKPTVDTEAFLELDEGCTLDARDLKDLAQMLSTTYTSVHATYKTTELLVAAYRGYDMLAADFDDTKADDLSGATDEERLSYVIKLIDAANEKASADQRVLTDYTGMSLADAKMLINSLRTTVDLNAGGGFFDKLLRGIGIVLGWITNTLGGGYYIIGICIFAIVVELLMLPLTVKQHKSSIKQAKLRPKEMAIRKKYAGRDDQATRQKMSNELMELQQRENVSPMSGCLPLLIQMPIILALYNIVIDPLHYVLGQAQGMSAALQLYSSAPRAAGGLGYTVAQATRGTVGLLSQIGDKLEGITDFMLLGNGEKVYAQIAESGASSLKFTLGGVNLGDIPSPTSFNVLLLVPVLTFIIYFFSMRLTKKFTYQPANPSAGDDRQVACSNWMMDITMPLMSVYITFITPALIGIYWMFKSILSTLTRFIITRILPYPVFTEEDYKAAEREYAGKASKNAPARQYSYARGTKMVDGKPRSLFHMDDDDYVAKVETAERAEEEKKEAETAVKTAVDGAKIKTDDRPAKSQKTKKTDDQND